VQSDPGLYQKKDPARRDSRQALTKYPGTQFIKINSGLRTGKINQSNPIVALMDMEVNNSKLPDNLTLWRGITAHVNWNVGETHAVKAFLSTTLLKDLARWKSGNSFDFPQSAPATILEIRAQKNRAGLYMNNLDNIHGAEHEFLLPRNASLKVIEVKKHGEIQYIVCEY